MIKIIDYKAGNAPSVLSAALHLGHRAELVHTPSELVGATHIILPGVGAAGATIKSLDEMGFIPKLEELVLSKRVLFLGVCVGMQILFEHSEEENAACLSWLKGSVVRFDDSKVKVPQMGWNNVRFIKDTPCNIGCEDYFYFVNSYYAKPDDKNIVWGTAEHGGEFTAAVNSGNIYATQFHIEKSGEAGLLLLDSFLKQEEKLC